MRNSAAAQGQVYQRLTDNQFAAGARDVSASFKQDSEKLSGAFKNPRANYHFRARQESRSPSYPYKTDIDITITMIEWEGDSIKSKADFGGLAEGDWSGKRGSMVPCRCRGGSGSAVE
jgi:hypothetical protein